MVLLRWTFLVLILGLSPICIFSQSRGHSIGVAIHNGPALIVSKHWISDDAAIDAALSFNFQDNNNYFYLHSDFLMHDFSAFQIEGGSLPTYMGVGLRSFLGNVNTLGVRVPLGASYIYKENTFEMFFELAPFVDFINGTRFSLDGSIGFRIFL